MAGQWLGLEPGWHREEGGLGPLTRPGCVRGRFPKDALSFLTWSHFLWPVPGFHVFPEELSNVFNSLEPKSDKAHALLHIVLEQRGLLSTFPEAVVLLSGLGRPMLTQTPAGRLPRGTALAPSWGGCCV